MNDVFQEYPKWVKSLNGKDIIVHDAREEMATICTNPPEPPAFDITKLGIPLLDIEELPTSATIENIRPLGEIRNIELLRADADQMGLIYDKRWGIERLNQVISNAKNSSFSNKNAN